MCTAALCVCVCVCVCVRLVALPKFALRSSAEVFGSSAEVTMFGSSDLSVTRFKRKRDLTISPGGRGSDTQQRHGSTLSAFLSLLCLLSAIIYLYI